MNEHCARSHVSHMLARAIALTFLTIGLLLAILANTIAMSVHLHTINAKLAAFNDRITAITDTLEKR
jgi:hypothetical protein